MNLLAVDIGGTFVKYALISDSGEMIQKRKVRNELKDEASFLQFLTQLIIKYQEQIAGVGLSLAGVVNVQRQEIISSAILPFLEGSQLFVDLERQFKLPIVLENDGNCAALAEQKFGSLKQVENGAMLVLGTGVGGALFLDHQLVHGTHFVAAEPSFMILNELAPTGREQTAANLSVTEMVKRIGQHLKLPDENDGRAVFQQIAQGEPFATQEFNDFCYSVSAIMFNLQTMLDLECIVIGGGISQQPLLIKKLVTDLRTYHQADQLTRRTMKLPEVRAAHFFNDANLIGAIVPLLK